MQNIIKAQNHTAYKLISIDENKNIQIQQGRKAYFYMSCDVPDISS